MNINLPIRGKDGNHEAEPPKSFRHYFRRMVYARGRLYAAADQATGLAVEVPRMGRLDAFNSLRDTAIELPGTVHWRSEQPAPTAQNFRAIKSQTLVDKSEHFTVVSFDHDTFLFVNSNPYDPTGDILNFFHGTDAVPGVTHFDPTHWFYHIQHLALIPVIGRRLSAFDRQLLAGHPSLTTIAITVPSATLFCGRIPLRKGGRLEHMPLAEYLLVATVLHHSRGCCFHQGHVEALESLRAELVELFTREDDGRSVMRAVPDVRVVVELTEHENADMLTLVHEKEECIIQGKTLRITKEQERNLPIMQAQQEDELNEESWEIVQSGSL